MNPYEELSIGGVAEAESVGDRKIVAWLPIALAGLTYILFSVACGFTWHALLSTEFFNNNFNFLMYNVLYYVQLTIPWIAGAAFLAKRARSLWALQGLFYSVIPAVALLSLRFRDWNNYVTRNVYSELFLFFLAYLAVCFSVTVSTMAIVRLFRSRVVARLMQTEESLMQHGARE